MLIHIRRIIRHGRAFNVSSEIFGKYKLVSAGENVIKYISNTYCVPELLEIYTKEELESLGFGTDYPIIENLKISGNNTVGSTLTPVYDYSNTGGVAEGENVYEWYRTGLDGQATKTNITSKNYTVSTSDIGCNIFCTVIPYDVNNSRGYKANSVRSDEISADGFSVSFDGLTLNDDGTAEITFNFGNMNGENVIAVLEVFDGYNTVDSQVKEISQNGTLTLSAEKTADNAYAKAFVADKNTNKICVVLTKNYERKPAAEIQDKDYSAEYDSDNRVYVLSGVNPSVTAASVYIELKKTGEQEPVYRTCEFVDGGKLLMYFKMPDSETSGDYTIEICSDKLSEPVTVEFYYSSIQNKASILETLKNAKTSGEYAEIFSQKLRELEISDKYVSAMDVGGFEFIGASLLGKEYSTDTINEFYKDVAVYSACYNLSHSKTGKDAMECADYYRDKIKLDENVLYGDFAALDNGDKTEVFSLFNGKKINNPTELSGVFEECVILTKINGAESYGMLNNYLIKYETYLPFSLNDYKASDTTAACKVSF